MDLKVFFAVMWTRKWLLIISLVTTVGITIFGTQRMTPVYEASATLRLATATTGSINLLNYNLSYADRLMNTYIKIASTQPVLQQLSERLDLRANPEFRVEAIANTELIRITSENPDPNLAAEIANTLADILITQSKVLTSGNTNVDQALANQLSQMVEEVIQAEQDLTALENQASVSPAQLAAAQQILLLKKETLETLTRQVEQARILAALQVNTLSIIDPAITPKRSSKPDKNLIIGLGVILGLFSGLGLSFLFENFDTRLYTNDQIEMASGMTILGQIPKARLQRFSISSETPFVESFRRLSANLLAFAKEHPIQTLLMTSSEPREGISTVLTNLALALTLAGKNVLLVDSNLRNPTLHKIFDLPNELGLFNLLRNSEEPNSKAIQDSRIPGLKVLTTGSLPDDPFAVLEAAQLLSSNTMISLLKEFGEKYDMVLLDTPALMNVAEATTLAPLVDAVLIVIGRRQTREVTLKATQRQLRAVKANVLGIVLNRVAQHY